MEAISRRSFVKGASLGVAAAAAAGALASSGVQTAEAKNVAPLPSQTLEADVVIVGSGVAGLAAGVEAVNSGLSAIMLEHNAFIGGSGMITFGILGVGTKYQEALGIDLKPGDIVKMEAETFCYRTDGALLKELMFASAGNIEWLEENGVEFSGEVDTYMSDGHVKTYHWWKNGKEKTGKDYCESMWNAYTEKGGVTMLETKGGDLIKEDGKVVGIYATDADGNLIELRCKAVVMATGGFEEDPELLEMKGYNPARCVFDGITGHDGSGIKAAWRAGAKSWLDQASLLENPTNCELGASTMVLWMNMNGREMVVNGRGERFFDESCLQKNRAYPMLAIKQQWRWGSWQIFDQQVLDAAYETMGPDAGKRYDTIKELIPTKLEEGVPNLFQCDSVEEIAEKTGIDLATLQETFENYERYCDEGVDEEFGKPADRLVKLEPPFFVMRDTDPSYITSFGGIHTGRDAVVLDEHNEPIPGLYAAGTCGAELWPDYYSICMPGAANAYNVHSGRKAIQHAIANLL